MRKLLLRYIVGISLGTVSFFPPLLSDPCDKGICFRFYEQWRISEKDKKSAQRKYGVVCLLFDQKGTVILDGLSPPAKARFIKLYNQCMQDGCLFCDAEEGSCEEGTCGPSNTFCKPYIENGSPLCGEECAYYALHHL